MVEPCVMYDERRRVWVLERTVIVHSRGYVLEIPGGFEFDLASIPRLMWNVIAPFELSITAPLVHDWLYRHGGLIPTRVFGQRVAKRFPRVEADKFFRDLMEQEGVSKFRRTLAFYAVRLFGGSSWQGSK